MSKIFQCFITLQSLLFGMDGSVKILRNSLLGVSSSSSSGNFAAALSSQRSFVTHKSNNISPQLTSKLSDEANLSHTSLHHLETLSKWHLALITQL